ncbi:HNH endonuclease [Bacillus paranthracis]|uniref:HNH endonuclease n=1 Tax=Bacillus paranthracis TaxID=2026186 RepID=UPI0013D13276|nr:HNH endonuclease [Bacillus paranthracis]
MSKIIPVVRRNGDIYEVIVDSDFEIDRKVWVGIAKGVPYAGITIDKKNKKLHRYILGVHNEDPNILVDHINGNPLDNRKENLRTCTHLQNLANKKSKGCYWDKYNQKWRARIGIDGKLKSLGSFNTPEEAQEVYQKAHAEAFGEFSPYYKYDQGNTKEVN